MGKAIVAGGCLNPQKPNPYDPVFANNTWSDIIAACQNNNIPDTWNVGDSKAMTINGTSYAIDIIGKNHDTYSDGSGKAPLTFQMHDCYAEKNQMCTGMVFDGWTDSPMRTEHLPAILKLMPSEVQTGVREVNKLTCENGNSSNIVSTTDKLFLLSEIEIFGVVSCSKAGEGTQYEYYVAGNSKIKKIGTTAEAWWERSPYKSEFNNCCVVTSSGNADCTSGYYTRAIAFAFCF